jgi:hypothetical protein
VIGGLDGGETPGEPSPDTAEGPVPAPLLLVSIAFLPLLNDRVICSLMALLPPGQQ